MAKKEKMAFGRLDLMRNDLLPNHKKITHKYINHVVSCVDMFYKNS